MRRWFIVAPLLLLFLDNGYAQSSKIPRTTYAPAPARLSETVANARSRIQDIIAERAYPGMAVAVSVGGETIWSEGFGYANLEHRVPIWPTTKFRIGSISKPLTAAAIAKLYIEGRIDLDAPVQKYVPSFPEKKFPLTTRQLGAHLGGIRHYRGREYFIRDPYSTVLDGIAIFAADTLLHQPGTKYSYTSYGWNLISAVVEGASGETFLDYMRREIFRPLQMYDTVADHVDSLIYQRAGFYMRGEDGTLLNGTFVNNSHKWAGGGFLSTSEDLLRFGNAHLSNNFLSEEGLALLFTEQKATSGEGVGYGFGWFVGTNEEDGRRYVHHAGGSMGGTSLLTIQPDTRVVVVGLVNLSGADLAFVHELTRTFVDAVGQSVE